MEKFSKLAAPASDKLRQLQKMVQDIKKNDDSILNRLKRFQNEQAALIRKTGRTTLDRIKNKPPPKVPTRDYPGDNLDADQWSGSDFDSDTYEDPQGDHDDSYEPPPCERVFNPTPSNFFPPRGEYVDSCRGRPNQNPTKPPRHQRASRPPLPPKTSQAEEDEEDYIDPEDDQEDDNYIDPSEKAPTNPPVNRGAKPSMAERSHSPDPPVNRGAKPSMAERSHSPDVYEVPDQEEISTPVSRPNTHLRAHMLTQPPRASPRLHVKNKKALPSPETEEDDEYEICDPDESVRSEEHTVATVPTPLPRETKKSNPPLIPKPSLLQKPSLPTRENGARPLISPRSAPNPKVMLPPSEFPRAKLPLPLFPAMKPPMERENLVQDESGPTEQEEDAGVCKKAWYASNCGRKTAEDALTRTNKDGAYLLRKSSGQDAQQPYTLVVFYNSRVYNIPVRYIAALQQYALGREKKGEEHFSCVSHIIENHQRNPLVLIDTQSNTKDTTKLRHPVQP